MLLNEKRKMNKGKLKSSLVKYVLARLNLLQIIRISFLNFLIAKG